MDRDDHTDQVAPTLIANREFISSVGLSPSRRSRRRKTPHRASSPRKTRAGSTATKTFLLDTNVLLHDPGSLNRFAEHEVCIPVDVLSELDRFKNEMTERGANAREVHRSLMRIFAEGGRSITEGVPTPGGGRVRLVVYDPLAATKTPSVLEFQRIFPGLDKMDHRILACVLWLQEEMGAPVTLVSKDLNMQLKARAVGIGCEDYRHDKVEVRDVANRDIARLAVTAHELQRFASSGRLTLPPDRLEGMMLNDYALLQAGEAASMPARLHPGEELQRLHHLPEALRPGAGRAIKPMNLGQACLLDALLDPSIALVTCYGQAGTGKTLLAVAAGLQQVMVRTYQGITISRPIVAMGQTVGFLPGSLEEKMRPWLQPIYDALDLLLRPVTQPKPPRKTKGGGEPRLTDFSAPAAAPYEPLIQQGILEIEALCYIRGRSIPDRFFVLDEAQQLTPLEAKTVVTRMSRGSKLVLVGDPAQIDNPYVDSRSNGLVYTRQRMRGQPFATHVPLVKGERSPLAEAGAQLL
ncbi:MAG: PhoH family protein [Verrucomicrobiales bacterium]|nr:PhoH family protein [Verrucomicrobiales bacterium]